MAGTPGLIRVGSSSGRVPGVPVFPEISRTESVVSSHSSSGQWWSASCHHGWFALLLWVTLWAGVLCWPMDLRSHQNFQKGVRRRLSLPVSELIIPVTHPALFPGPILLSDGDFLPEVLLSVFYRQPPLRDLLGSFMGSCPHHDRRHLL